MSNITLTVLIIIFSIFFVGEPIYMVQSGKRKIRNFLKEKNVKNITVHLILPLMGRGVYFYEVTYEDEAGMFHVEKCKKYSWDSSIHWLDEDFQYK